MKEDGIPTNLLNDSYTSTGDGSNFVSEAYFSAKKKQKRREKILEKHHSLPCLVNRDNCQRRKFPVSVFPPF